MKKGDGGDGKTAYFGGGRKYRKFLSACTFLKKVHSQ